MHALHHSVCLWVVRRCCDMFYAQRLAQTGPYATQKLGSSVCCHRGWYTKMTLPRVHKRMGHHLRRGPFDLQDLWPPRGPVNDRQQVRGAISRWRQRPHYIDMHVGIPFL